MSSGDFNLLHLRNLKMYNPDGSHPAVSSIFTISTNGVPQYTNSIALSGLSASSITTSTLNSGSIGFSTMNGSTLQASSITGSTINITSQLTVSTLSASTISTNLLTTNDIQLQSTQIALGLSTTSTQVNFSQGSYAASSWLTAKSGLVNPRKLGTSSTGQYQLVVSGNTSDIWLSSDSGITWSQLTPANTGLPTLTGSAYWSSGSISANGQYILLGVYGGSLWLSQDYGRTFATTAQPTPDIWLQLNGSLTDTMGSSTVTPYGSPGYVSVQQPGFTDQAINLANTAGSTATQYVRGTWAGAPNFTVSFWMNPQTLNGTNQMVFIAYYSNIALYITSANTLRYEASSAGTNTLMAATTYALSTNTWYYVNFTFQTNGICSLYVNNTLIGSTTNINGLLYTSSGFYGLGTRDDSNNTCFNGYIADLRIHNSAIAYNPIPLLAPNIWLPFENSTQDLGAQSANSQGSTIYCPFEGSFLDQMGVSTVSATGSPGYVAANRAGYTGQAINLANSAGGTATQYVRGDWTPPNPVNFSVSFWFNPQTINATQQVLFSTYTGGIQVYIQPTTNYLLYLIPSGGGSTRVTAAVTSSALTANTWYYVTIIFQTGQTCAMYLNNTLVGSVTNSSGVGTYVASPFSLGTFDNSTSAAFNGYIDDFRLYNYAITYNPVSIMTVSGSLSYVPGVVGLNAVRLANTAGGDASSGAYIRGACPPIGSDVTVSGWVNTQSMGSSGYQVIFSMYFAFIHLYIDMASSIFVARFPSGSGSGVNDITSGKISINTWYHIYMIFRVNGTCSFYLNGALANNNVTNSGGYGSGTSSGLYALGTYENATTNAFNGYIDDFRIYNAAIPYHLLNIPQNYRSVALSGTAQYALASAASGWVVGSSTSGQTWSKQSVCVGTQGDVIQPNKTGLSSAQWEQNGVNWVSSASSTLNVSFPSYNLFNMNVPTTNGWASTATYTSGTGLYAGSVSTTIQGGIGPVLGEWTQIQLTVPLILSSYTWTCGGTIAQFVKTYYFVGSNDGSTWFPIQYVNVTTTPFTVANSTCSNNLLINFTGTQQLTAGQTGSVTTTSYTTSTTPYTYFRLICMAVPVTGTLVEIGELYLNFSRPSATALALSYSGQYQLVATNPAAGSIMPNQTNLASNTWVQGGVQWGASASSQYSPSGWFPYAVFNCIDNQNGWLCITSTYNGSGVYTGSVSTTIQGIGSTPGEWLQIQTSVPLVLVNYRYAGAAQTQLPKIYYIVGSMDGSTWYPLQYANTTVNPFNAAFQYLTTNIIVNSTSTQSITSSGVTGSVTTTSYSYSTQPFMYFRWVITNNFNATESGYAELYLNFSNSVSYSSNYGSTWSNSSNSLSNEIVSLSPSGQYALSTNCVPPLARLTMDNTSQDSQGSLTYSSGAPTSYSSSIVKVGTHSAYFNNTAGGTATNILNYTVPSILNTPSALTISFWVYPTSYDSVRNSTYVNLNNGSSSFGILINANNTGVIACNYNTTNNGGNPYISFSRQALLNTWTHIAVTYIPGSLICYYNGVFAVSAQPTGNISLSGGGNITNIMLGCSVSSGPTYTDAFAGYIDDVRLYTQALSAHEVAALYSNPALTQSIGVSSSYLPITSYSKPVLPNATANVVDAKVSQTGQYMVAVTAANTNNVYYSVDSGSSFNALSVNGYTQAGATTPLARLPFDNASGDVLGGLTQATGAGTVTYSTSIKKVGTHSAFFNNTAPGFAPSVYLNYTVPAVLYQPSSLTMACWVYPTAFASSGRVSCIMVLNQGSASYANQLYISSSGQVVFYWATTTNSSGTDLYSSINIAINTWSHLAVTFNAGTIALYVNGVFAVSVSPGGLLCAIGLGNLTNLLLGASLVNDQAFQGYVDDVRLYTSALTATEIAALYAGTYDSLYTVAPMAACSISNDGSYLTVTNTAGTVYTLNRNANTYTLALGNQAGQVNQASNAIAIGNLAGQLNQSANSIVLNASGSALNATAPGFYVAPIAGTAGLPMELLGYGSDSQVTRTGVTVYPSGLLDLWQRTPLLTLDFNTVNRMSQLSIRGYLDYNDGLFMGNFGDSMGNNPVGYIQYQWDSNSGRPLAINPLGGNVGIGTTNPGYKLDILGNCRIRGGVNSSGFFQSIIFGTTDNNSPYFSYSSIQAAHEGSMYNSLSLNPLGGNVGIGTASPGSVCTVYGSTTTIATGNSASISNFGQLCLTDSTSPSSAGSGKGSIKIGYDATVGTWGAGFITAIVPNLWNPPLILQTSGGNVGIGTTNPTNSVVQIGNATSTVQLRLGPNGNAGSGAAYDQTNSTYGLAFSSWQDTSTDKIGAKILGINRSVYGGSPAYLVQATDIAFFVNNATGGSGGGTVDSTSEVMRIRAGGNVGIGVTNPGYQLTVRAGGVAYYNSSSVYSTTIANFLSNLSYNTTSSVDIEIGSSNTGVGNLGNTYKYIVGAKGYNNGGGLFFRVAGVKANTSDYNGADSGVSDYFIVGPTGTVYLSRYITDGSVSTINSNGQLSVSSDRRIKENIIYQSDTQQALTHVLNLKPATYSLIGSSGTYLGFIAQDVEQEIPLAVDGKKYEWVWEVAEDGKPKFDADGNIVYKLDADGNRMIRPRGIQDRAIIATQTLAIQELAKRATSQSETVQELSKQVDLLKSQLASAQQQLADKSAKLDALIAWAQPQGFSG